MTGDVREFKRLLEEIRWLDAELLGKNLLQTWEHPLKEIQQVLYTAEALKWLYEKNISVKCVDAGLALLHIKAGSPAAPAPWTQGNRFSFNFAANSLGLTVQPLEQFEEDFSWNDFSFLREADFIGFQGTSLIPLEEQADNIEKSYIKEFAAALTELSPGEKESEFPSQTRRPGVINLHCDSDFPAQAMADMLVLKNHFGSLERLKEKKMAITWIHSPHKVIPPSVPQGIAVLAPRFGMEVTLAYPEGYDLNDRVITAAQEHAQNGEGSLTITHSPEQALKDADAVYAMNWISPGVSPQKTGFENWTNIEEKIKLTRDGNGFAMECHRSLYDKPHVIAALMINYRFKEPARVLGSLKKRETPRCFFSY